MAEYIDKSEEVHEGYLTDWYINSVAEYADEKLNEPRWTEAHIEELTNDFIVIPKDTPAADVAPVAHGYNDNQEYYARDEFRCSVCGLHLEDWIRLDDEGNCYEYEFKYCPNCGAKMDEEE